MAHKLGPVLAAWPGRCTSGDHITSACIASGNFHNFLVHLNSYDAKSCRMILYWSQKSSLIIWFLFPCVYVCPRQITWWDVLFPSGHEIRSWCCCHVLLSACPSDGQSCQQQQLIFTAVMLRKALFHSFLDHEYDPHPVLTDTAVISCGKRVCASNLSADLHSSLCDHTNPQGWL